MNPSAATSPLHFNADQTHSGVRLAALAILAFVGAASYLVGERLFPFGFCARGMLSLGAGLGAAWVGETLLKRCWPSGRWMEITPSALRFCREGQVSEITLRQGINQLRWKFRLSEHRARGLTPANWECFAVRLTQGETALTAFAFLPPRLARRLAEQHEFHFLPARSEAQPLLKSRHARHLTAERSRARDGMELEPADFARLLEALPRG